MVEYLLKRSRFVTCVVRMKLREWGIYRFRIFIWIISGMIEPIVWSGLWFIVSSQTRQMALTGGQVLTYYALIALVGRITHSWTYDDLRKEIYEGKYSKYLLWPSSMTLFRFGLDIGNKVMNVATMLPLWFLWVGILAWKGLWSVHVVSIGAVFLSIVLAVLVKFTLDVVLAHAALWIDRAEGVGILYNYLLRVFGGMIVPLSFLPYGVTMICYVLPFRYVFSFPVEVIMGTVTGMDVVWGFGAGMLWCLVMLVLLSFLLRKGLPKYEAIGI